MSTKHLCHWPGCRETVPPRLWGCSPHWFSLPVALRRAINAAYVPGQEVTKTPSPEYLKAAVDAQTWIKTRQVLKPTAPAVQPFNETKDES